MPSRRRCANVPGMQDFTKLIVWQRAQGLAVDVNRVTERMSERRSAGLRSQLRRASASIAANIAEGASTSGAAHFARYLQIAIASSSEVESHLDLAARLQSIPPHRLTPLVAEVQALRRMLIVLRRRVLEGTSKLATRNSNSPLKTE